MNRALLVIAKRPAKGQTKTRLTPPLSGEEAARLYECFLQDMLDIARETPGVTRLINYWPADEADYFKQLAPDFGLILQRGKSLGERLDNVLTHCLTHGFDQVVITNSDSPTLPAEYLARAFDLLNEADVLLGPCNDGGYYLIGLKQPQPRLLLEVEMSTPTVAADTLALAEKQGLQTALLPKWYDVDTVTELNYLMRELEQAAEDIAPHTRQYLLMDKKALQAGGLATKGGVPSPSRFSPQLTVKNTPLSTVDCVEFNKQADWIARITASGAKVEKWLAGMSDESWANLIEGTWTIKDLVGHLAAWSDLLLDQIEALAQNTPDKIQQIDIDHWNETQITARSDRSVAKVRKEWAQSAMRAQSIVKHLPEEILSRRAFVPWTKEPVSIEALLDLWLLHITQHKDAWEV